MNVVTHRRLMTPVLIFLGGWLCGCAGTMREGPSSVNYVPDASYHLMMAEIAVQRTQYLTAAQAYLDGAELSDDPELAQRATEYAYNYGYDVLAMRAARRWQTLDPDNTLGHEILTRLYLRRHDLGQALVQAELALGPADQRTAEIYLSFADDLAEESNVAGVTRLLSDLRGRYPEADGLQLAVARAALRSGAYDLALEFATGSAQNSAMEVPAHILVARAYLGKGDTDLAVEYIQRQLISLPDLQLELEYVRLLGAVDEPAAARGVLARLVDKYGSQPEFLRLHALTSFAAGDLDAASQDFNQLLTANFNIYECFFYLGQIADEQEGPRSAIEYYNRISNGPYFVSAQVSIGLAYDRLGDPQTGLNQFNEFARTYPRYAFDVLEPRVRLMQSMGREEEALQEYQRTMEHKPDNAGLLIAHATLLERMGRVNDAISDMRHAVALEPASAMSLNTLGYTLTNRTRRQAQAYDYIRLAMELEPDSPPIIDSLGWVLFQQGQMADAQFFLERAYDLMPDPEVAAHLGEVLWVTDQQEAAREIWTAAQARYPDSVPLNQTMDRLTR
jgi:tetratricopeptide (TPR) repeat protein